MARANGAWPVKSAELVVGVGLAGREGGRTVPPRIDRHKCDGCGLCLHRCGAYCFGFDMKRYVAYLANGRACVDCFICEEVCPEEAIQVYPGRMK